MLVCRFFLMGRAGPERPANQRLLDADGGAEGAPSGHVCHAASSSAYSSSVSSASTWVYVFAVTARFF